MTSSREKNLLLVEDDVAVRDALTNVLTAENYAVHCAASTEQALAVYRAHRIDVVLLDLNLLGEEDGWETFHALKQLQGDLPILVTSAQSHRLQHSSASLASAVLEKPFDLLALLNLLDAAPKAAVRAARSKLGAIAAGFLACVLPFFAQGQSSSEPGEFRITDLQVRSGAVTVSWQGGGATNQLQSKPSLEAPWTDVDAPTAASSVTHVMTSPNAFYRVVNVQDAFSIAADKKAPSTPTGLSVSPVNCNQINLSWSSSTDSGQNASGVLGYNVYRNGIFVKQVLAPTTSTSDTGLNAWTTYSYSVSAVDRSRNTSAKSAAVGATTPACGGGGGNQSPIANAGSDASVTAGTMVSVNANGSYDPDGSISLYSWDMGDGTEVTGFSFSHTYYYAGTYVITLTVTDNNGARTSDSKYVFVSNASDTTPPSVTLDSPGNGSTVSGTVNLSASAYDNAGVTRVEFYLDGSALLGTATAYPFTASWNTTSAGNGNHTLFARAYDAAGNASSSGTYSVAVNNPTGGGGGSTGQPLLQRYFGGIGYGAGAITKQTIVDRSGNKIIVGSMYYTVDFGSGPISSTGGQDIFVAKYFPSGQCAWARHLGGVSEDSGYSVALDSGDNIILIGSVSGPSYGGILDFGTGPQQCKGGSEIILVKYSSNGSHVWTKVFGGSGSDVGTGVAVDSGDNILMTGTHAFFGTGADFGVGALPAYGQQDVFLTKLNSGGGYIWAKSFGGSDSDVATSIALDSGGNPVIAGQFRGASNLGGGGVNSAGDTDAFVARYSGADGRNLWYKRLGDGRGQTANSVAVDPSGNVIVTGDFLGSIDFGGSLSVASLGGSFYVAKYNSSGGLSWVKTYGADISGPHSAAVAADGTGQIVVAGEMITGIDFGLGWLLGQGGNDAFVLKFDPAGTLQWAKRGAPAGDRATALAIDRRNNNIVVAGDCGGSFGADFGCQNVITMSNTSNNAYFIEFAP